MLVDERADLLVARTRETDFAGQSGHAPMNLRDRHRLIVETLDRGEQHDSDPGRGSRAPTTVAGELSPHAHEPSSTRQVTVCYLASPQGVRR